ncbi:MAG TPA: PEP-CTERM sorting domain-containing protein [Rhizomicrobium sp.]|jgi:hypothetical protein|nr:PEP-CTERM sorting domain-containing protein [Rhizomicrobium sp.]
MSTRKLKYSLSAAALMAVVGMAAPVMADTMNVSVNSSDGVFNDPDAVSGSALVYFAGAIQYKDATTNILYNVFCDDPGNDVVVPGTYTYNVENEAYANAYLAPLPGNSTNLVTEEIAGLMAYGLANPTKPTLDEYVQEAIWKIMGADITLSGATANGVTHLINIGGGEAGWASYWNKLALMGWEYGELVDPGCGDSGQITYKDCQTQGQMYLYGKNGSPPNLIPEPGTMGLLGVGLLGLAGATWRRRRSADRSRA